MKRFFALLSALLFLLSCTSCSEKEYSYPEEKLGGIRTDTGEVYPETFLNFDGVAVPFDAFRYFYLNYRDKYLKEDEKHFENDSAETALKEEILNCLLDYYAVQFLAKENNVELNEEEMDAVRDEIRQTIDFYGDEEAFLEVIHKSYMSHGFYYKMMEYSSLYFKLFNHLYEDGGKEAWTDEEFYAYYREHYLAVQQIFIPYEKGENSNSYANTLAKANGIHAEATSGKDFWKLIEDYGEDDAMIDHPDGLYFTEGEAEDVLYEASKKLAVDEISAPVAAETGIHIIKRVELKEMRMQENRSTALFGYYDTLDEWHSGAYDNAFYELYRARAEKIKVEYSDFWNLVSTKSVF
ncbi:MAG: peptidylprolyl isomerase [Clostridia bacterium]|nr:peptidylprolyl isomerase [Clostridia bacterium]